MERSLFACLNLGLIFGAAYFGMKWYLRTNPDVSQVNGSRMLSSSVRGWFFSNLDPFDELFIRWEITPTVITLAQLVGSVLCAVAYASGLIYTGGFLVLASGTLDILDGRLARRTRGGTKSGAFLDSVVDRYSEFIMFAGLLIFFEEGWPVWAILLCLLGGIMVSYTRARAEGLGQDCRVGFLQRPERFVILGFGSIFSSALNHICGSDDALLKAVILILAVFTNLTAVQRILYVYGALERGGGDA